MLLVCNGSSLKPTLGHVLIATSLLACYGSIIVAQTFRREGERPTQQRLHERQTAHPANTPNTQAGMICQHHFEAHDTRAISDLCLSLSLSLYIYMYVMNMGPWSATS